MTNHDREHCNCNDCQTYWENWARGAVKPVVEFVQATPGSELGSPELLRHMFRGNEWVNACAEQWGKDKARIEELDHNGGLLASLLREAWLFKGYGAGPLASNNAAIRAVLNDRAALARKQP